MATISQSEWKTYCGLLRRINDKAVTEFKAWVADNLGYGNIERQKLIDYAYAIATKYGEASSALSAEMYDSIAARSNASVAAAIPAETATYPEVSKTVNGIMKNTNGNTDVLADGVGRLVKMAGTDTILMNAARDSVKNGRHKHSGAQVAWIPMGDTCSFCLVLASKGWQQQTVWAANSHSEHIHANCDCTYAVRFDDSMSVEGYDPNMYKRIYDKADGSTSEAKIRAMDREKYAKNRDEINARKRAEYAARKERNEA